MTTTADCKAFLQEQNALNAYRGWKRLSKRNTTAGVERIFTDKAESVYVRVVEGEDGLDLASVSDTHEGLGGGAPPAKSKPKAGKENAVKSSKACIEFLEDRSYMCVSGRLFEGWKFVRGQRIEAGIERIYVDDKKEFYVNILEEDDGNLKSITTGRKIVDVCTRHPSVKRPELPGPKVDVNLSILFPADYGIPRDGFAYSSEGIRANYRKGDDAFEYNIEFEDDYEAPRNINTPDDPNDESLSAVSFFFALGSDADTPHEVYDVILEHLFPKHAAKELLETNVSEAMHILHVEKGSTFAKTVAHMQARFLEAGIGTNGRSREVVSLSVEDPLLAPRLVYSEDVLESLVVGTQYSAPELFFSDWEDRAPQSRMALQRWGVLSGYHLAHIGKRSWDNETFTPSGDFTRRAYKGAVIAERGELMSAEAIKDALRDAPL